MLRAVSSSRCAATQLRSPQRWHSAVASGASSSAMDDKQFQFMRKVIAAPSPVGLEASMTQGVIAPEFEAFGAKDLDWQEHKFRGNAGTVWDTGSKGDGKLTVMICGHADKIRMQVRSISSDGKIWINSDSFLPLTLLGNVVTLFSEDPAALGTYRKLPGFAIVYSK